MIINSKVEKVELPQEHFHALLCDPPYHLGPTGFMNKHWDKDGPDAVAFNPATWARLAQALLPGAFGMAFASSRGWHRLAVAIEDAGLIIHPSIFCWNFSSGFPKATRIDTQVDAAAGAGREVIGSKVQAMPHAQGDGWGNPGADAYRDAHKGATEFNITAPATPLAAAWEGHRYGLQAMKPAIEPIILFQKPYQGRPLDCITSTGAGALHIEGGRISTSEQLKAGAGGLLSHVREGKPYPNGRGGEDSAERRYSGKGTSFNAAPGVRFEVADIQGRWPANFVLDEEAAARLDLQTGELSSGIMKAGTRRKNLMGYGGAMPAETIGETIGDSGGASRFFHTFGWNHEVEERLEESDSVHYCAKAGRMERNAGLSGPKKPMLWSSGTQNPGSFQAEGTDRSARNPHPCVKPIDLTRWLASLLLPPDLYAPRRLLVPFAGSGSEMIGGYLAGWEEVTGIENDLEYIPVAEARIKFWQGWGKGRKPQGYQREGNETKQQAMLF